MDSIYEEIEQNKLSKNKEKADEVDQYAKDYAIKLKNELLNEAKQRIPAFIKIRQAYDKVMSTPDMEAGKLTQDEIYDALEYEAMNTQAELQDQVESALYFKKKTADALMKQEQTFFNSLALANKLDNMYQNGEPQEKIRDLFSKIDPQMQKYIARIKLIKKDLPDGSIPRQNSIEELSNQIKNRSPITKSAQEILQETFAIGKQ